MRKPLYICLPYRGSDHEYTMVYAGSEYPGTDGDIIKIEFDDMGRPIQSTCQLVHEETE